MKTSQECPVQHTLGLSVTNPKCLDFDFSICQENEAVLKVFVFIFFLIPHPSDQLAERSHMSTTALQCSEDAEIDSHSLTNLISDKVTY